MQVADVIRRYPDEFEADLLEFFGVDLGDVWRRRITFRKLAVYLKSLLQKPGRSTLIMAMNERTSWTDESYLLARISDALEVSNYLFLQANSDQSLIVDPPQPIPRPGDEPEPEKAPKQNFATPEEVAGFFTRFNS